MPGAATVFVKDLDAMASFYATCFGLAEVAAVAGDFRVLESETWTLSVVQVPPDVAATISLSDPPVRRDGTPVKLSFDVPSLAAARSTIARLGGHVDDEEWEFRGYRHCDCTDPEGNVVQLREAVAPE